MIIQKNPSVIKYFGILIYIFIIIYLTFGVAGAYASDYSSIITLESLDLKNSVLKSLRKDTRTAIMIIKRNGRPENLPDLKFYKYKVKKNENFWHILAKTSLNMDTIATINFLSSPNDVYPGKEIFLSNMRGIIYEVKEKDTIEKISKKYDIDDDYIHKVNNINNTGKINNEYLFIPLGEISNIDRSLFLGSGFACPLKKIKRTSSFGRRIDPFDKRFHFHNGIDLKCPVGTNVYAARKGKIFFTGYYGGYGLLVILKHENGYSTYYGHLKKIYVKKDSTVKRGELIAISGNTGRSTGPHLHFEVRKETRPINPGILLK